IERGAGCATFMLGQRPSDGALVHPHLASVAVVAAHWLGRETFHAGAFLAGGGVWGVLGDKEAGKSSLLASLALAGVPVVSDDILVLDQMTALAGPRSIDLRAGAARHLAVGEAVGVMGTRERWRLVLGPIAAEAPMRGWVLLRWDTDTGVRALSGSERLIKLAAHRGGRLYPPEPGLLVALSALPVLELRRPHRRTNARVRSVQNASLKFAFDARLQPSSGSTSPNSRRIPSVRPANPSSAASRAPAAPSPGLSSGCASSAS